MCGGIGLEGKEKVQKQTKNREFGTIGTRTKFRRKQKTDLVEEVILGMQSNEKRIVDY